MLGTIVNVATVIVGSLIGIFLHTRLPKRLTQAAFNAIGIFTLFLGISMALKTHHILILVFSILPGAIVGELLKIDQVFNQAVEKLKTRFTVKADRFTEGLISAFLLFCMGSMTILGAVEEGLGRPPTLYLTKSLLDGVAAVALSAALGIGVLFSVLPLFIYQAGLTVIVRLLGQTLNPILTDELTAVGGLILIALGVNLLEIKQIKIVNLLPALAIAPLLGFLFIH
ncbi:MAG: DUF554 domain-containing protein [candidate division WOR-3 bacterium]|nr:DUF554 domain-containing protein [candidate division WOR-3 bacterium]MCR4424504.1 DUF554 domain-containing protein [candidate division WOR-3 bacterium]MDH7519648.1 DUF554 domain-containing protein [bacterium]